MDFENDRVKEIHTNYNGEPYSVGWNDLNVKEQLSKVKPISNIVIRDEQDIYNNLTNREKLETLIEEYEKKNSHRLANEEKQLQICCDEKSPCVPTNADNDDPNNKKIISSKTTLTESLTPAGKKQQTQQQSFEEQDHSHKGEKLSQQKYKSSIN